MLAERNLVRVVRVRFIAINRLRAVRILRRLANRTLLRLMLDRWLRGGCLHGLRLCGGREGGGGGALAFGFAWAAAGEAGDGGAGLEAGERGGVVHWLLGLGGGVLRFRAVGLLRHVFAGAAAGGAVFVEREGVDGLAVRGLGLGAEVEYPDDLLVLAL